MILKLNVAGNVNSAFNNFLNEEVILNRECPVCLSKRLSGKENGGSWKICYYSPKKIFLE